MASQLAGLRAQRTVPRGLIRHGAAIPIPSAIAADLPADGRGRSAELGCDRPQRTARDKPLDISSRSISLSRSEEHTSELQSLMRNSYDVFCLKKKKHPST